jgi:hypothetical protein
VNAIYSITIDEYLEIIEIAKKLNRKPGESIEDVFLAYMKIKGQKPIGNTELTKEEMLNEMVSKGNKILDVEVNNKGETNYKIIKPKD